MSSIRLFQPSISSVESFDESLSLDHLIKALAKSYLENFGTSLLNIFTILLLGCESAISLQLIEYSDSTILISVSRSKSSISGLETFLQ